MPFSGGFPPHKAAHECAVVMHLIGPDNSPANRRYLTVTTHDLERQSVREPHDFEVRHGTQRRPFK